MQNATQHLVVVPSFSTPGKSYVVKDESCTCPAYTHRGLCRKHVILAECFERIEALPFSDGVKAMHSERLLRLAKRVFSRPRATETAASSYDLFLEVLGERYATEALLDAAHRRHGVVTDRYFGKGEAA